MRDEARMYWLISQGVRSPDDAKTPIDEARDEFDVLASYSDWPTLRRLCADNLSAVLSAVSDKASVA